MKKKFSLGEFALNILKCFAYFITWYLLSNLVATFYIVFYRLITKEANLDVINNALDANIAALTIIANCLTIFIFMFAYKKKKTTLFERANIKKVNISTGIHSFVFGAAFLLVINILLMILANFAPQEWFNAHTEHNSVITNADPTIQFFGVVLIAPLLEEILFRGLIGKALSRNLPNWVAIILSSLIFGAVHGTIISFMYASVLGIFMCWLFFKTDSLLSSILFHMGFNTVSYFMSGESIPLMVVAISFFIVIYEIINFNKINRGNK